MLQGYELWLVDREGRRAFRPAAAADPADVIREARGLLEADASLSAIAIDLGGQRLMTLESPTAPPEA